MASRENLTKDEKRLQTLDVKTEEQKKAIVLQLRKMPIVQVACERVGIGRSTYYKWRANDRVFARVADKAHEFGKFFINDMAESKLLRLIQDDNLTAIIFWLKHNNPRYATVNRFIHEYESLTDRPSVEENNVWALELARAKMRKMKSKESNEEIQKQIEDELAEAERNEPERRRKEALQGDSEDK